MSDPIGFDADLEAMLAELEAAQAFRRRLRAKNVQLLPEGGKSAPDFLAEIGSSKALVEVKRADGQSSEIWLAYHVVEAWRLLYPELRSIGITI